MSDLQEFTNQINAHRDARDWRQFHTPKDLALSLVLEAAEVLELFQWKKDAEAAEFVKENKERIGEELADVLYWVLTLADDCGVDMREAFERKMKINEAKYPVEKAKGRKEKYTEL